MLELGEGNGIPLQYSCVENPMDGGAWWAVVHGVARSRTRLSDFTLTFHFHAFEEEMATHSSVLAWRIPWTEEPGGLPSIGSHRVRHNCSDLAAAAAAVLELKHGSLCSSLVNILDYIMTWISPLVSDGLYAGQKATVRTGHGTTDLFQIGKGVRQGCILSPCLFNFYVEYIMINAGLEEAQAGIKIAGRNINHLRYADDTTLMAESEEELKAS